MSGSLSVLFWLAQSKLINSASATTGRISCTGSFSSIGAGAGTWAGAGADIGIPF